MRKSKILLYAGVLAFAFGSCQKNDAFEVVPDEHISDAVLAKIHNLGFGTKEVTKIDEGYLVEGDIVLTPELLDAQNEQKLLRVANFEQYRTTNLVTGLPRTITISVDSKLGSKYVTSAQNLVNRYNALNLSLNFQLVSSGGDIRFVAAPRNAQYLASAGFPTSTGQPYNTIKVNATYLNRNAWNEASITSVMAHEVGHCIGFRHTDYMDRSYSCGGAYANEGASTVGAINIPGTPTSADPNSWMLACIGKNVDRPFNNNDKVALNYLY